jgi:hypothetical protein
MNEDTRKLLKVFWRGRHGCRGRGGAAGGHRLPAAAGAGYDEVAQLLRDARELRRELNTRWLEVTERVVTIQGRLQHQLAEAGARLQAAKWAAWGKAVENINQGAYDPCQHEPSRSTGRPS